MIHTNPYLVIAPDNSSNSFIYRNERVMITDLEAYFSAYGFPHEANDEIDDLKTDLKCAQDELKTAEDDLEELKDSIEEIYKSGKKRLAELHKKEIVMRVDKTPISDEDYLTEISEILENIIDDIYDLT
jgi:peptidoglycan hydrolase CwlO-like protein